METDMTFVAAVLDWRDKATSRNRRPMKASSVQKELSYLRNNVICYLPFGLSLDDMGKFYNAIIKNYCIQHWKEKGLSPLTQEAILKAIGYVLHSFYDESGNRKYPVCWNRDFLDTPLLTPANKPAYSAEQVSAIVRESLRMKQRDERKYGVFFAIYNVLAGTGMRLGEMLALRCDDVKADKTLVIERRDYQGNIDVPKSAAGIRVIDLCDYLYELIMAQRLRQERSYEIQTPNPLLFSRPSGTALTHYELYDWSLYPIVRKLQIADSACHAFRRFRTTHLQYRTVPESLISYWMGWKPTVSMLTLYSRITQDAEWRRQWANRVGLGFDGI